MPMPDGAEYTVLVAHVEEGVRTTITGALAGADELSVVGRCASGSVAVEQALDQVPDAVLVGSAFDDASGMEVVHRIRSALPVTVLIALIDDDPGDGSGDDESYVLARAGALSSLRVTSPDEAARVTRGAIHGESLLPPRWAERATDDLRLLGDEPMVRPPQLSSTEVEVLERLAKGEPPADIAREYDVEERLVNLHTGYAVAKLHWAVDELRHLAAMES